MRHVLIKLDFFSPYTSVPLYAEHGRGLLAPPPSTLIGALAAAYYYPEEREVSKDFAKRVHYVSFWVPPYTEVENISRHFTWLSQKGKRKEVIKMALDFLTGKASDKEVSEFFKNHADLNIEKFNTLVRLGYSKSEIARIALQKLLKPATRLEVYYWEPAYVLYVVDDELEKYARHIFRVGPKETLVAATPVEILGIERAKGRVRTRFYARVDAVDECRGVINYMLEGFDRSFEALRPYCIPPRDDAIEAVPRPGWTGVVFMTEEGDLEAIMPDYAAPQ